MDQLTGALTQISPHLASASPKAMAVAFDKLFGFARAFNVPVQDSAATTRIYREMLGDLPADLLLEAVTRVCGTWRWGNRLPMPADIRDSVHVEHAMRLRMKRHHEYAIGEIERKAKRDAEVQTREPLNIPVHVPSPKRLVRDRSEGGELINLGNVQARIAAWEKQG